MATIKLQNDCPNTYVSVPGIFIDEYLTDANGEFVKVYLYLLRCMSSYACECSISAIADHFEHTEKDVLRALKYWEKVGVLRLEMDEKNRLSGISFSNLACKETSTSSQIVKEAPTATNENTNSEVPVTKATDSANKKSASSKKEYTLDEIRKFNEDPDIAELLFIMESYLKHPLNSTEMNTVFYWIDHLHFSRDLVEYLVEYCITNGHSSLRYMDKVALGWADSGITTVEQAKEQSSNHSNLCYAVMKAFGISGRNLIDSEISDINKWNKEFGFDISLIEEACRRTIVATHQPNFKYADSILTNWHSNNVHTLKDIDALDATFSKTKKASSTRAVSGAKNNKFNNFNQRQYDYDEYEKMLLTTSVQ